MTFLFVIQALQDSKDGTGAGAAEKASGDGAGGDAKRVRKDGGAGWKVLQDDMLVGSSLKDWDKDNSDSDEEDDE